MRKFVLVGVLVLIPLIGLSAQETLTIEAFEYPPIYQDGVDQGLACELVTAAFAASNVAVKYRFVPVLRMIQDLADETSAACVGGSILFANEAVRSQVRVSAPFMYVVQTFLYDERQYPRGIAFSALDQMSGFRIGVLNGSGIMRFLSQTKGLNLVENKIHEGSAKQLYTHRIDLWAIVDLTGFLTMRDLFPDEARFYRVTKPFETGDISLIVSEKRDKGGRYVPLFEAGLAIIEKNGTYMKIMAKYYGGRANVNREALVKEMR